MSFSVTLFGPSHYWWNWGKQQSYMSDYPKVPRAWFDRSDEYSTGGAGFCIPGLHVVFTWGRKR